MNNNNNCADNAIDELDNNFCTIRVQSSNFESINAYEFFLDNNAFMIQVKIFKILVVKSLPSIKPHGEYLQI